MQAFEHRLFGKRGCDNTFVTTFFRGLLLEYSKFFLVTHGISC
ncbi:hypothetical protein HMPREF9525_02254 [Enterococcus faecium TX0133a04]|nr:hypothetical protein HMPREF9524_02172 [Enterococcus faecium TX0133a01]EFS05645.1 hypothetical protein HMPREF9525_02254 [Enterococcus faecium TX0133a04]EJY29017.1 hypothetical protein HMPREF1354_02029 [Enterococcus faecium 514]EJY41924.1 hypothetical protein HMPREF1350_01266 [Enterococcus faecium 509]